MKTGTKVLITGADGQLGKSLTSTLEESADIVLKISDVEDFDITKSDMVSEVLQEFNPDFVVNTAAYTAVDKAEDEEEKAFLVNEEGPANLAKACKEIGAVLIHVSTDYVYHSDMDGTLNERSPVNPVGIYARSKLAGEQKIRELMHRYYIIRTSWLYSEYGNNFVKTMYNLMLSGKSLRVVDDQHGSPTYAADLADLILKIIGLGTSFSTDEHQGKYGVYNYSNTGFTTWYGFACKISELANLDLIIEPVSTEEFPVKAARPKNSRLDTAKVVSAFDMQIPHWEQSLAKCMDKLINQK